MFFSFTACGSEKPDPSADNGSVTDTESGVNTKEESAEVEV